MASQDLLKLFDRPTEPVFMPKGRDNTTFDIPQEFLSDRFKPLKNNLDNRFGSGKKIAVKKITLPDLSLPEQLGRRAQFSLFIPSHRAMAARLVEVFMGMRTLDDFISATVLCRDRMNPYMYIYALSVAIIHRPDTQNLEVPSFAEVFPDKYMNSEIFARAKEESNIVPEEQREPLEIPRDYTASDLEIEHRVAYFREDVGINLHHWHWHLVYPFDGPRSVVNKDRRGELFYYMHQQIMARYNMERLCNNLARDIYREIDQIKFDLQDLERWRDRIFAAIHSGTVVDEQGQFLELSETRGIDILGNLLEASILSTNRNLYGDLHNLGHVAIALCHDPEAKNLETFSIMGDPATAMRDPIFYRWHAFIDDIFAEHKNTLPRYTTQQVENNGGNKTGTCRIFIAPKFDERGLPMLFRDQKNLFVELDKFTVNRK
ncbi:Putative prophenoloxidase [Halyomorpha halys]|nr:Putative prophenoloxidase [Halyomorpha halys]